MNEKTQKVLQQIKKAIDEYARQKKSGQLTFVVNFSEGGIGDCEIHTKGRMDK